MNDGTTGLLRPTRREARPLRGYGRSRRLGAEIALFAALLFACASPDAGPRLAGSGTIIGSVEVVLARPKRSVFDGFLEVDLTRLPATYSFRFGPVEELFAESIASVGTMGAPRAFALTMSPGRHTVEDLEIQLDSGPDGVLLSLLSPIAGREVDLDLEFPVERDGITYIGRIRVVLPTHIKVFSTQYKLTVEDREVEDYASMASFLESVELPVRKRLATRIR